MISTVSTINLEWPSANQDLSSAIQNSKGLLIWTLEAENLDVIKLPENFESKFFSAVAVPRESGFVLSPGRNPENDAFIGQRTWLNTLQTGDGWTVRSVSADNSSSKDGVHDSRWPNPIQNRSTKCTVLIFRNQESA